MIIKPRIRGFICTTAHPTGCAANVNEQITYTQGLGDLPDLPKRILVVGCSTGYGLASRIVASFAGGAETIGVSLEKDPTEKKSGSAGWYNNRAFEKAAAAKGLKAITLEQDGFSHQTRQDVIDVIKEHFGQIDMLVYSMASPVRKHPDTDILHRSAIKPLGAPVTLKTLNTDSGEVYVADIEPATEEEAANTVAVMGGEDWGFWVDQLDAAGVLADGFQTMTYTYLGSDLTWPIYWHGTLGRAKEDMDREAARIREKLCEESARVVALKAVVTQASSAIPVVPLYGTILFDVMKDQGTHEGCIEQINRLFRDKLGKANLYDDEGRVRVDDWELADTVQNEIKRRWPLISTETMGELADLAEYKTEFLKLFGFGRDDVDYEADVDPQTI